MRRGYARSCSPRKTGIVIGEWHSVLAMVPTAGHHGLLRLHSVLAVPQLATTDGLLRLHPSEGLRRPPKPTDMRRVAPCRRTASTSTSCSLCCRWFCPSPSSSIGIMHSACPRIHSHCMLRACSLHAFAFARMPLLRHAAGRRDARPRVHEPRGGRALPPLHGQHAVARAPPPLQHARRALVRRGDHTPPPSPHPLGGRCLGHVLSSPRLAHLAPCFHPSALALLRVRPYGLYPLHCGCAHGWLIPPPSHPPPRSSSS